MEKCCSSFSYL